MKVIKGENDLATVNPKLADEWDYIGNGDVTPSMVTVGSNKKVAWIGKCGHRWVASIKSRNSGTNCPYCSGNKVLSKYNDLDSTHLELVKEWDFERNVLIRPTDVSAGSHKKVWWKCSSCGYSWKAEIKSRALDNKGCPCCAGNILVQGINDLLTVRPDIAKEWDDERNGVLRSDSVSVSSHVIVWWKCSNGHEWKATVNNRTSKGRNCPYCCHNPRALSGNNDLATRYPRVAKEWDYEKNEELRPEMFTSHSDKIVYWRCKKGHIWRTSINHRVSGSGCPKCASGKQTSFPEQAIFYYISNLYPDAENGYTNIFHNHGMEIDIYVQELKIGIEYDGVAFHRTKKQIERESKKYSICKENGIKLIRIREDLKNIDNSTCDDVFFVNPDLNTAIMRLKKYFSELNDVDVERDKNKIEIRYRNNLKEKSLLRNYPFIANEWDYEMNLPLTPELFSSKSNRKVWWKCSIGHSWKASIYSRVRGTGCPYCSNNKVLTGFNDIETKRPDLMLEWDYEKNGDLLPSKILPGSGKKAWWKCNECGNSWYSEISSRNKGHGCPRCGMQRKSSMNSR